MEGVIGSGVRVEATLGDRRRLASVGIRVGLVTAACWTVFGLESILRPEPENYRDLVWVLPFSLTAVTLTFLHGVQRSAQAGLERVGYAGVMTAMALVVLGNVGLVTDQPLLAAMSFPWGALLWTVALFFFGAGTWRAGVVPWYVGLALILLEPGSIVTGLLLSPIAPLHERGGYSAGVEKGLAVAIIAIGLRTWHRRRRDAEGWGVRSGGGRVVARR